MKEEIKISFVRYRDSEGRPTCATNFETGEVCQFYRTQRFGCNETCIFAEENHRGIGKNMMRRNSLRENTPGDGTLIPLKECPLWAL